MKSIFNFSFRKRKQRAEHLPEKLRLSKSIYPTFPEGTTEEQKYNSTWNHIARESQRAYEHHSKISTER